MISRLSVTGFWMSWAAQNEDPGDSPAEWFKKKYSKDADYSELLDELYDQGMRQAIREYF